VTKQGELTLWRQQREGQVRAWKESNQARDTYFLEMAEGGTSQDMERKQLSKRHSPTGDGRGRGKSGQRKKRMRNYKIRDREGKTDPILVVTFFQQQVTIHAMVLQLTQSDGNAVMHFFITASVLPFPFSKSPWDLEWDYTHLFLVLLCIRTYHRMACFTLRSRLSLCTATSMRATTPLLSTLAVMSMRPAHRCPSFCISAGWILILLEMRGQSRTWRSSILDGTRFIKLFTSHTDTCSH